MRVAPRHTPILLIQQTFVFSVLPVALNSLSEFMKGGGGLKGQSTLSTFLKLKSKISMNIYLKKIPMEDTSWKSSFVFGI